MPLKGTDELVEHPSHYIAHHPATGEKIEVIDVVEAFHLGYHRASAVAYVLRAGRKGTYDDHIRDIKKAIWYLQRYLDTRRSKEQREVDDAFQKREAKEVDAREQAGDGEAVGNRTSENERWIEFHGKGLRK